MSVQQLVKNRCQLRRKPAESKIASHPGEGLRPHLSPQRIVRKQTLETGHELRYLSVGNKEAIDSVINDFRRPAVRATHHRPSASHGLDEHQAETFAVAWHGKNFAMIVSVWQPVWAYERKKMNSVSNTRFPRQELQPRQVGSLPYSYQLHV